MMQPWKRRLPMTISTCSRDGSAVPALDGSEDRLTLSKRAGAGPMADRPLDAAQGSVPNVGLLAADVEGLLVGDPARLTLLSPARATRSTCWPGCGCEKKV